MPAAASEPRAGDSAGSRNPPLPAESTLSQIWAGQRFPPDALVTRQGATLSVHHPGRPGRGAGPDFRGAVITTPSGGELRGDVELHVRAGDFRAHGHQRDPRYDGVVLHVVFEDDGHDQTELRSGRNVPIVALAPWARRRAQELTGWLARPQRWREPCANAVARLGREAALETLEALGDRRFEERAAALQNDVREYGRGAALYRALLVGLSYGGNRDLFAAVAEAMPWPELSVRLEATCEGGPALLAEALLLGSAGLLPSQGGREPEPGRERALEERWLHGGLSGRSYADSTTPARPANHPARRLAGLAKLLVRHGELLRGRPATPARPGRAADLIADWSVAADDYWRAWLAPGVAGRRDQGALVGRSRAIELLVNAVLPWLAASGDAAAADAARTAFVGLPRPGRYGALAFLEEHLAAGGKRLSLDARRQQGLVALYKTECTRGGCGRCELS